MSSNEIAGGVIAALGALFIFVLVIGLVVTIITVIEQWKVLEKGGKPGWACLIPFYGTYVQCDMVGVNPWWILVVFGVSLVGAIIPVIGPLVEMAATVYFGVLLAISTAKAFGKDSGFGILLFFLPIVGYGILAFGKDKFVGKNPMHDIVFDEWFKQNKSNTNTNTTVVNGPSAGEKFCPSCGTKASSDTKFCPSCGKEM